HSDHALESLAGGLALRYREEALPYASLSAAVCFAALPEPWVLIVTAGGRRWALGVPLLLGEHDLIRQPLDRLLCRYSHLCASASRSDGGLVLILQLTGVLRRAEGRATEIKPTAPTVPSRRLRALVVEDSDIVRELITQILSSGGFDVEQAENGRQALE